MHDAVDGNTLPTHVELGVVSQVLDAHDEWIASRNTPDRRFDAHDTGLVGCTSRRREKVEFVGTREWKPGQWREAFIKRYDVSFVWFKLDAIEPCQLDESAGVVTFAIGKPNLEGRIGDIDTDLCIGRVDPNEGPEVGVGGERGRELDQDRAEQRGHLQLARTRFVRQNGEGWELEAHEAALTSRHVDPASRGKHPACPKVHVLVGCDRFSMNDCGNRRVDIRFVQRRKIDHLDDRLRRLVLLIGVVHRRVCTAAYDRDVVDAIGNEIAAGWLELDRSFNRRTVGVGKVDHVEL